MNVSCLKENGYMVAFWGSKQGQKGIMMREKEERRVKILPSQPQKGFVYGKKGRKKTKTDIHSQ